MFDHTHYVPILKWKRGEYRALEELLPADKAALTPLAEVQPAAWDYEADAPSKSLDAQLANVPAQMEKAWGTSGRMLVDLAALDTPASMSGGEHAVDWLFAKAAALGLQLVPVTGLTRDPGYQSAVAAVVSRDRRGACIRLTPEDLAAPATLTTALNALLASLKLQPADVDLVVDLRAIGSGQLALVVIAATNAMISLPNIGAWRSLTLTATAFPQSLAGISPGTSTISRDDWLAWNQLLANRAALPRMPTFGDYGIQHPELVDIDPRTMVVSAGIRYTTSDEWMICKGQSIKKHGSSQFATLCQKLVKHPNYTGRAFSKGDECIDDHATGVQGPGSPEVFRRVGTNHHLTFVVRQLANHFGTSGALARQSGGP